MLYPESGMRRSDFTAGNVRAEAARAGFSQTTLAKAMGVSQSTVNARWRGLHPWSLDELDAIAALVGVEFETLTSKVPTGGSHRKGLQRAWRDSNPQPSGWYPSEDASSKVIDLEAHRLTRTESRLVYIA